MRRALLFLAALLAAGLCHGLASRLLPWFPMTFDIFIFIAVYNSLGQSPIASAAGGSAAGLVADALSGGYFGLFGFANTLAAWGAAQVQQRIVLQQPLSVGLLMSAATVVQMITLAALRSFLLMGSAGPSLQIMLLRVLTSGILGAAAFSSLRRLRRSEKQWRDRRSRRLRIES